MRIMIIGAGDIGMTIIHDLSERDHLLTVIDLDDKRCKEIANHSDATIFQGNGTDLEIWKNIEADKIDALLALTNDDEANIKVCEIAKKQFGIPFIIARVRQPENKPRSKEAGADVVICPAEETRRLFLNALERLNAETLCEYTNENFRVTMVTVPPDGGIIGKTVDQLEIPDNCKVVCVLRNGTFVFLTEAFVLKGEDRILLLGSSELVGKASEKLRNVEIT